jgi:hypothetical protein
MPNLDIARQRLLTQGISDGAFASPEETVRWLGAVQSQDYLASLWGIGLRTKNATIATVEQAIADKAIVRTLLIRNTVHIVASENIRWLLTLAGSRMRMIINNVARANKIDLSEAIFEKSKEIIAASLQGGKQLTRAELCDILQQKGVPAAKLGGLLLVQRAHADGLVCYAPRKGKRHYLTLLDEWLPAARDLPYDEALARLTLQYFRGHGPATAEDFAWWSGLTLSDARRGFGMVAAQLAQEKFADIAYWLDPATMNASGDIAGVWLLPNYDEYTVGYRDRSAIFDDRHKSQVHSPQYNIVFANVIVADGEVVGTGKRVIKKHEVQVSTNLFSPLTGTQGQALSAAADRYGIFAGLPAKMM